MISHEQAIALLDFIDEVNDVLDIWCAKNPKAYDEHRSYLEVYAVEITCMGLSLFYPTVLSWGP